MEFFADIKEHRWARMYTALLLTRRLLFVVVIITLSFIGRQAVFITLLVIQIGYWVVMLVLRPFRSVQSNLVELTNETFFCVFVALMLALSSEKSWTDGMTKLFLSLMTANTIIVAIITIGTKNLLIYL